MSLDKATSNTPLVPENVARFKEHAALSHGVEETKGMNITTSTSIHSAWTRKLAHFQVSLLVYIHFLPSSNDDFHGMFPRLAGQNNYR